MSKKKSFNINLDKFQKEMAIALINTKILELEFVNTTMMDLIYKDNMNFKDAYLKLRDIIYKRIDELKKGLVENGVENLAKEQQKKEIWKKASKVVN
jgi:hypothetical protein